MLIRKCCLGVLFDVAQISTLACADSIAERNGLIVKPPDIYIKNKFFIADNERELAQVINSAVPSIVEFVKVLRRIPVETNASNNFFPKVAEQPHLPPIRPDAPERYVVHYIYCWRQPDAGHLQFLVEWADVTSNRRYVASYVMKKTGKNWQFDRNGNFYPWFWVETPPAKIRTCPS
jgi:hypothetical protein